MATKKIKNLSSRDLNQMKHKGAAASMVLQPQYGQRIVQMKNKTKPVRKMKHKGRAYE